MSSLLSIRQEILPPNGVEFCTSLRLTPSSVAPQDPHAQAGPSTDTPRTLGNVVVARSSFLRIYELREDAMPVRAVSDAEREKRGKVRRDTEAVEGEVEMDAQGEGFVNMGSAKPIDADRATVPPVVQRLHFMREYRLHGVVTGLESIRTRATMEDRLDRLLVSFKDAKIALMEWSEAAHDLITVSIHTYERAPQLMSLDPTLYRAELRVDTQSRCAALLLPKDALAILPFYQSQVEFETMDQDQLMSRDVPYSPSFILDLPQDVDERIQHVIDFTFLPGFANPTLAILFETQQTTTSRLGEFKDTVKLFIFTLDMVTRHYPIITAVEGLPFDCFSMIPCPSALGGVLILTSNAIVHVDQASRRLALSVNGWTARVTNMPLQSLQATELTRILNLEGSRAAFIDDRTLFLVLRDGSVRPVELVSDGRVVSKLSLGESIAQTTGPSGALMVAENLLFVASLLGPSVLLKTTHVAEEIPDDPSFGPSAVADTVNDMDLDDDDDDDIYGESKIVDKRNMNGHAANGVVGSRTRDVIHLSLCDALPAYGPITGLSFSVARNGERHVAELVAATGAGHLGGFTLFQRELPSRTKKKLHAIGGTKGMWSLPIRQSKATGAVVQGEQLDTLIISTDASPSPGLSRIAVRNARNDINITIRLSGLTVSAAPFFQGTAILHIMIAANVNQIRILEPDGTERQNIKDVDGTTPRARIRSCYIADPFVLIIREDDTLGLFVGETERGRIRRKDMSPMGHKTSRYQTGCFFTDESGHFKTYSTGNAMVTDGDTSTLQSVITAGQRTQWLVLCRPQGIVEIWALPKLALVFSTASFASLEQVARDSGDGPASSVPEEVPKKYNELDIDQLLLAPMGESSPRPHVFVLLRSGHMAVYEAVLTSTSLNPTRDTGLVVEFAKVASTAFDRIEEEREKSAITELKKISRQFIPFTTSLSPPTTMTGVFFTGDRPCWILRTDKGGTRIHVSGHHVVQAFTTCSLWESPNDFLMYTDEGPSLVEWMPDIQLHDPLPSRFVPRGRGYSNVLFEATSGLIVAASCAEARFGIFDEEGVKTWDPDAPNIDEPVTECSSIELISPDGWITMDGFEFANNEVVNALDCVSLETTSTESGTKDFIAVGTTLNRGEDLAVKGAAYIFEIVEVVADPAWNLSRWYKLRLLCRDEAKGPVTALCGLGGYLVSSMGQKIYVRAFDQDERLVGIAFLDVGVYVTSLRALKNLLLVGDVIKSVWFVAFQEDPYKLVIIGKDVRELPAMTAEFLFADEKLGIVSGDDDGVLRVYDFDPSDPESKNGQCLLCRSEFQTQSETRPSATVTLARRIKEEDMSTPQARLLYGATDGSVSTLTPLDDETFKRFHLLQGHLTRNVQHFAGLNPKAFRVVKNESVSKPLAKNILDGRLISEFVALPVARQDEFTRQIGTERGVILRDWRELTDSW